ncbi:MAG: GAF domain-containing sensor histidine kinase [Solirubrobacterales bacterium]|nr:GAF domain-containing sensor histidine kinase [Solirubrobacterales bacterium]
MISRRPEFSDDRHDRLADEHAALRRVATMVADAAPAPEVLGAVAAEAGRLVGADVSALGRYERTLRRIDFVGSWSSAGTEVPLIFGLALSGCNVATRVFETGGAARLDDRGSAPPGPGSLASRLGVGFMIGVPIVIERQLWGCMCVGSRQEPLPLSTERRLGAFVELLAGTIGNVQARTDLTRYAREQAALRRVATLVARGTTPDEVFDLTTTELSRVLDIPIVTLVKFEEDGTATVLAAASSKPFPVGTNLTMDGPSVIGLIRETGLPARIETYAGLSGEVAAGLRKAGVQAGYGAPIIVNGKVWGAMAVAEAGERSPADVEARLAEFTELEATAISNAQARQDLTYLAQEQASLRHVATLVARHSSESELFSLVAEEIRGLLGVPLVSLVRYDSRTAVVVGVAATNPYGAIGDRWDLDGPSVLATALDTGLPARLDEFDGQSGSLAALAQTAGFRTTVGAPIVLESRVWGAILAASTSAPLPDRTEIRLADYTELVATAIVNAATRAELVASRARIVAASDEGRRRLERDLHDTIQQRLIALALDIQRVRGAAPSTATETRASLDRLEEELQSVLEEVQELSRGLHPALLSRGGLLLPLRALARRSPIPVELHVATDPRPPEPVEIAAYYTVSEAFTNAIKHSRAARITIEATSSSDALRVVVRDDGAGGATPGRGSGLAGMTDRVHALGGTLDISSVDGEGTTITAVLPLP